MILGKVPGWDGGDMVITKRKLPIVMMGDFYFNHKQFLFIIRYYSFELEISTECIVFIRTFYRVLKFLNHSIFISSMIETRLSPNSINKFIKLKMLI